MQSSFTSAHVTSFVATLLLMLPAVSAQTLDDREQQLLVSLNAENVTRLAAAMEKLDGWRQRFAVLRESKTAEQDRQVLALTLELIGACDGCSADLQQRLGIAQLTALLSSAQDAWQNIPYDPQNSLAQDEAEFREDAKMIVESLVCLELVEQLDLGFFTQLNALRDPVQYAHTFLKGKYQQWLSTPVEHEVLDGLRFVIRPTDPNRSVFDPQGGLTAVMAYDGLGGATLEATGLYFEYDPGKPVPKPNIDNLQLQPNWQSLLPTEELLALGEISGMGFTLTFTEIPRFDRPDEHGRRGGLRFKAAIKIVDDFPKIEGRGIIYADGTVKWAGPIRTTIPATPPIPLGTTGAAMHECTISFDPTANQNEVSVAAKISAAAPESDRVLNLDVTLTLPIPVDKVTISGIIKSAQDQVALGDVEGVFDFRQGQVRGKFAIPGTKGRIPVGAIYNTAGEFELKSEGFFANGGMEILGQQCADMVLDIPFNGHGSLAAKSGFEVLGADLAGKVTAGFTPGFGRLWLNARTSVQVPIEPFGEISCTVMLTVDSTRPVPLWVHTRAFNTDIDFPVPGGLGTLDLAMLSREVAKHAPEMYKQVLHEVAQGEAAVRDWGARFDDKTRRYFADRWAAAGLDRPETGIPALDDFGGQLSAGAKDLGGAWHDLTSATGGALATGREDLQQGLSEFDPFKSDSTANQVISDPGSVLGLALFAAPQRKGTPADLLGRLEKLSRSLDVVSIDKALDAHHRVVSGRRRSRASELHVKFLPSVTGIEDKQALILVPLEVSGYQLDVKTSQVRPRRPDPAGHVQKVKIEIQNFIGGGRRPTGRVRVPKLRHDSTFAAELLVRDRIHRLLKRYLPEVEVVGPQRFNEKQFAVRNESDEPITVWLQRRSRVRDGQTYEWKWLPNQQRKSAMKFSVPAKSTKALSVETNFNFSGFSLSSRGVPQVQRQTQRLRLPVSASRVRFWAESESGERWDEYRDRDRWLVAKNPKFENQRCYYAEQMARSVYTIKPRPGVRAFSERVLSFRNETDETLEVALQFRSRLDGITKWRTRRAFKIPPRKTVHPLHEGRRIRASGVRFSAEGPSFLFDRQKVEPLWLVKVSNGQRVYRGERIGSYVHVFKLSDEAPSR